MPKVQFTARAFRNGVLVSTTARTEATATNPAGNFVIILPGGTGDGITLELAPDPGTSDPWVTYPGLSLTQQTTDLGAIMLPAVLKATPFQVTVHGGDGGRDAGVGRHGARVHDARGRRRPGVGQVHPGRCLGRRRHGQPVADAGRHGQSASVHAQRRPSRGLDVGDATVSTTSRPSGPGTAPVTLLRAVTLPRRAVITGTLLSASGVPVANAIVTATGGDAPRCRIAWPDRPPPARPPTRRGRSRCGSIRAPTSSNTTRRRDRRSRG